MSETPASYGSVTPPVIEKHVTFTINDGQWDIQSWPTGHRPLTGKVYWLRIAGDRCHIDSPMAIK